jgi:cysteine desulfurase/selenocysteine lyase
MAAFDVTAIRREFPILHQELNGRPLVYLDNAATTQKPEAVIDAIANYYRTINANVHRGAHTLSERATVAFEGARETVRRFLNAPETAEVLWTRGCTESINLVAQCYARPRLRDGDEILVAESAHHSNIVPWQLAVAGTGAVIRPIPLLDNGTLDLDAYHALLGPNTRVVALEHVSNSLGTVHPVADIIAAAHDAGAVVVLDGAQAVAHFPVDVQALGVDFYTFSGHKLFGPTGIGVLYGRRELLEDMPPYQGGGEMIETVSFDGSTYAPLPYRFEAGTPDIAGAIGLAAAIDWLQALDRAAVAAHEDALLGAALERARAFDGLRLVGDSPARIAILSFVLDQGHPHDLGTLLDQQGVAVRTGHHCTQPVMQHFEVPGTVRASFSLYNTLEEVERLFAALEKARSFL